MNKKELLRIYKNIETNSNKRWESGISHHPKSVDLMNHIASLDFHFQNDYFCWKVGGDGDNGETLMYLFDMYFELQDTLCLENTKKHTEY